jgi:hypothetical protein
MFKIDFEQLVGNQKVFFFIEAKTGCASFVVLFEASMQILNIKEEREEFLEIKYSNLLECKIITNYKDGNPEFINSEKYDEGEPICLRIPRAVVRIKTTEQELDFIASSEQVNFIYEHVIARIDALVLRSMDVLNSLNKSTFLRQYAWPEELGLRTLNSPLQEAETSIQHIMDFAKSKNEPDIAILAVFFCELLNDGAQQNNIEEVLSLLGKSITSSNHIQFMFSEDRDLRASLIFLIYLAIEAVKAHPNCNDSIWEDFVSEQSIGL